MFSRRKVLLASLVAAPVAHAAGSKNPQNEQVVRAWYKLWADSRNWADFDALMTDDFAFSSPNGDDHISKAVFKSRCWEPNVNLTKSLDIELMMSKGDEAFVKYLGHTTGGKLFRNIELLKVRDGKIASIECFFGGKATYPSAVDAQKN